MIARAPAYGSIDVQILYVMVTVNEPAELIDVLIGRVVLMFHTKNTRPLC
jgi:hypothetical protein